MTPITSISHPYWASLGEAARQDRKALGVSQARLAQLVGLSVREYAALESGFVPPDVAAALGELNLDNLDDVLGWDKGTARTYVEKELPAVTEPSPSYDFICDGRVTLGEVVDRSAYPRAAWVRLGKAIQRSRLALKMTQGTLGYAIKSSGKSILRIEEGRVYGDPRTAPPGDYQSEKYLLKRLALLEMALEWEMGEAARILNGENRASASPAA
jgi:transcriptional regulator with XRE-family HTH domain